MSFSLSCQVLPPTCANIGCLLTIGVSFNYDHARIFTTRKRAFSPGWQGPLVLVFATGITESELKVLSFSSGCNTNRD
jgi:hypothetical protein